MAATKPTDAAGAPVRTHWVGPLPWGEPPAADEAGPNTGALVALAEASLRHGHHRVALQRVLKLRALGQPVPTPLLAGLQPTWTRLRSGERARMQERAEQWARLVQPRPAARGG